MNAHNANIALDVRATLARSAALDVTNDVLAALNQQLPTRQRHAAAAAAPAQQQPQGR